jgi:hypothetical protein
MTFADGVASHLTTHFTAGLKSAGMVFDNIIDKTNAQWDQTGSFDIVQVIDQVATLHPGGWGHVERRETADLRIFARVKGASANVKDRLLVIMDEVEHVLHWYNHPISGYSFHQCTSRWDGSDKDVVNRSGQPQAYGMMTFVAWKHGRTA